MWYIFLVLPSIYRGVKVCTNTEKVNIFVSEPEPRNLQQTKIIISNTMKAQRIILSLVKKVSTLLWKWVGLLPQEAFLSHDESGVKVFCFTRARLIRSLGFCGNSYISAENTKTVMVKNESTLSQLNLQTCTKLNDIIL